MGQSTSPPGDTVDAVTTLDAEAVDEIRRLQVPGQPNIMVTVGVLFRDDGRRELARLTAAIGGQDAAALRGAAHALKGSATVVGAGDFRDLCDRLERLGLAGSVAGAAPLVAPLEAAFARTCQALDRLTALAEEAG